MMSSRTLFAALRISAIFLVSTLFGWGLGQTLQDMLSPDIPRPTENNAIDTARFLQQLPPLAHAARLLSKGLGVILGIALIRRLGQSRHVEFVALALLFLGFGVLDVIRVSHGLFLGSASVGTVLLSVWLGAKLSSTRWRERTRL